jgi:hypothetical protein
VPFDFDGDGYGEVVAGLPDAGAAQAGAHSGVALIHGGPEARSATVLTGTSAGLPSLPRNSDDFGRATAGGDFDGDGRADLAIGVPGRSAVVIRYGDADGLLKGRHAVIDGGQLGLGAGDKLGYALVAGRIDADRYDDLAVGAPGDGGHGSGWIVVLPGGQDGLAPGRASRIRTPDSDLAGFGSQLLTGDIDGDGHLDLLEGARDHPDDVAGHMTYCLGEPDGGGVTSCTAPGSGSGPGQGRGTSSLAVADVNGDGYDDIVQGDADSVKRGERPIGLVRLWRGQAEGGPRLPEVIYRTVARDPESKGDRFGEAIDAGQVDADRFADVVVAARDPGSGSGTITLVHGAPGGFGGRRPLADTAPAATLAIVRPAGGGVFVAAGGQEPQTGADVVRLIGLDGARHPLRGLTNGLDPSGTRTARLGRAGGAAAR